MRLPRVVGAWLALASSTTAQNVTYCPSDNVCYAVNVPATTASSGSGDIYFQITGPSTMSWIGLGQGKAMSGSNIFMVYANAAGTNVTLSPRLGTGEMQPKSDTTAQVTLLSGSGIENGVMTANVRCSNCNSWTGGTMSLTDSSSNWIWSYLSGAAVSSDDVSANVKQHSKFGTTTLNLQSAAGGSSSNPFATATATSSTGSSSGSSSGSSGSKPLQETKKYQDILMAHAIMAPVAFVLLFPIGAMGIRALSFPSLVFLHAGWMVFTLWVVVAGIGLGIWMAVLTEKIRTSHALIGLVVLGSVLAQPVTGLAHHLLYKKKGGRNAATYPHVYWGRAVITLGIINGGLGLRLSDNTTRGEIIYAIVAGFMWLLWMSVILISFLKTRGSPERHQSEMGEELVGETGNNKPARDSESVNPLDTPMMSSSPEAHLPIASTFIEERNRTLPSGFR